MTDSQAGQGAPVSLAHIPAEKFDVLLAGCLTFQSLPVVERRATMRRALEALLRAWPSPVGGAGQEEPTRIVSSPST